MKHLVADVAECDHFLKQNPDIKNVQIFFTNQSGVPRGKNLRVPDLRPVYEYARFLPGTMLGLDITGTDVDETGLVWSDGDADRLGKPVPNMLGLAPWLGDDFAQVMLSVYELDGAPCNVDPRHVLQAVIDRFKEFDLTPVIACELEFFLMERAPAPGGGRWAPVAPVTGHRQRDFQTYGLRELDDFQPYFNDIYKFGEAIGLPLESSISEYAPGQMELGLRHRADALQACDEAILYKRLVKGTAIRHGFEATFMAKPHTDVAGSGMHLHISLQDKHGKNAFASEDPAGTELLRFAVGGMQALLNESMAVFAPNANSYRRFRANLYAPVAPTWGVNNRTVGFRVPAGPPKSRHIEHRICGADANPYLAVAALLAAVHHGLKHRLDPGPAIEGNGYEQAAALGSSLPKNWFHSLDHFAQAGDLYVFLSVRRHQLFEREGADVHCRVPISMVQATLGGNIEVPTLDGKMARINVPAGAQGGHQFRLRGKGMPIVRSSQRGDMYIEINVETPTNLTSKQKELLKEFEKAGKTSPESEGFFSKVKEMFGG